MSKMTWGLLGEIQGRPMADVLQSLLEAEGIPTQLIQEGAGQSLYPVTVGPLGLVQIFVPREEVERARPILEEFTATWVADYGADDAADDANPEGNFIEKWFGADDDDEEAADE